MTKIDAELDAYDEELCSFISEVRKDISNTLIDYQGISVLMHVPLPNLGGDTCPNGFMVDVGYFSDDINKYQLAGQNAVSGESGHAFKNAKFKDNLYVTAREITEGTVQEFETFNEGLENLVAALVTHDKERHPDVAGEWKSTHSPPLGRHIHHLPVSPYRPDVRGCHSNPILGIVYTLSVDEKVSSAMYTNLARSAMNVGDLIVKKLARTFFEEKLKVIFQRWTYDNDRLTALASFMLFHHWFFPHRPSVFYALTTLRGSGITNVYWEHFAPPPCFYGTIEQDIDTYIDDIAQDLVSLLLSVYPESRDRILCLLKPEVFDKLLGCISSVLVSFVNKPALIDASYRLASETDGEEWEYVTPLPDNFDWEIKASPMLPVFTRDQVFRIVKDMEKKPRSRDEWHENSRSIRSILAPKFLKRKTKLRKPTRLVPKSGIDVEASNRERLKESSSLGEDHWKSLQWLYRSFVYSVVLQLYESRTES